MRIKIYGHGWVGRSVSRLFRETPITVSVIDPIYSNYAAARLQDADIGYVCVPTPLIDGRLDTSFVQQVVRDAPEPLLIIRSTLMPGTCDILAAETNKALVYQPEYLGETVQHPLFDETRAPFMILGGEAADRRRVIELYQYVYNANIRIRQVTNYEAEIIKLSENRAIAFKIAQCQELYDACERAGVDYSTIREAVYGDDPRFNLYWTFVYPNKRGFNSKCIPKDVYGWAAWAESIGYVPELTRAMLDVNARYLESWPEPEKQRIL